MNEIYISIQVISKTNDLHLCNFVINNFRIK